MYNSSFVMIQQETRWGYIPPQQPQQQVVPQQYGSTTNIFNNYNAPVAMNQPVQQYTAMQQPMQQQPMISQQYGNGNLTNIFNNYIVPSQVQQPVVSQQPVIQQPNLMIPQVPAIGTQQQPTQIVFVPANLGATPPVATTPAPASNDSAMKLMLTMMTMLLGSLNKKDATDEENVKTTKSTKDKPAENKPVDDKPVGQSKTDNLDGKEVDGTIYYTASKLSKTVNDKAGKTTTVIGGDNNNITFTGDDGENTFKVGGEKNIIKINDLGGDDKILLEGNPEDWKLEGIEQKDKDWWRDRSIATAVYVNVKTGNRVEITTKKAKWGIVGSRVRDQVILSNGKSYGK